MFKPIVIQPVQTISSSTKVIPAITTANIKSLGKGPSSSADTLICLMDPAKHKINVEIKFDLQ
jgi:hypothetical protein